MENGNPGIIILRPVNILKILHCASFVKYQDCRTWSDRVERSDLPVRMGTFTMLARQYH